MFEYHLIGNVYKENYEFYLTSYYYTSLIYNNLSENRTSYDFNSMKIEDIMSSLKDAVADKCNYYETRTWNFSKYDDELDYKDKHKLHKQSINNVNIFDRYEEFDCIGTDREFRDNETIKIDEQDYIIQYKYNKELKRHELYLDYTIKVEIDEELKKQCEDKISELNKQIEEYNKVIDESEVVVDSRFKNYTVNIVETPPALESEQKSILNKIKSWFSKKHE